MITRAGFVKRMAFVALASGMLGTELLGRMLEPHRDGWTWVAPGEWTLLQEVKGDATKSCWVQCEAGQFMRINPGDGRFAFSLEMENGIPEGTKLDFNISRPTLEEEVSVDPERVEYFGSRMLS